MDAHSNHYDIAIVGAGVSGVYTGWRIATNAPLSPLLSKWAGEKDKPSVAVFEASGRIGGRLLSAQSECAPEAICEIGGMRYVSSQTLIRSLVENKLKLARHKQDVDEDNNIAFLRGKPLRSSETRLASVMPYNLTWAEQQLLAAKGPASLIGSAVAKILPEVKTLSGEELSQSLRKATFDGTPLYQHGFWNLLARVMSTEAYQLARTMVGYDSLGANANAVDMILEYFDFTPDVKYYLLDDGYDAVPWTLQKQFTQAGGFVFRNSKLEGFDEAALPDGTTGVKLHFNGARKPVTARALVLAMPRRSIELLDQRGPVLDPARAPSVQTLLNAVEPIPLYKLFVVYPFPWWQSVGVSKGRSLTDLPVHQCYYWPAGPKGTMPDNGPGIVMAYNDQSAVEFWGGLNETGSHSKRTMTRCCPPLPVTGATPFTDYLRNNWRENEAPHAMVAEMHRQLKAMHGQDYAPEPIDAAFMDWSKDPFGGGVHFWKIGQQSWDVLERMVKPVPEFPCYVCGEAWSTNQTWVEGALETAEILLQNHFKLPPPDWVSPNQAPCECK
jgi:Flavin containing amine oxidoreductase